MLLSYNPFTAYKSCPICARKALHLRHAGKQVVSAIAVALLISWAAITYL